MRTKESSSKTRLATMLGFGLTLMMCAAVSSAYAQSVEKSETSQQAKQQQDELELARQSVSKGAVEKPKPPATGRIMGDYVITSSLEFGYRFVDVNGSKVGYLSDVNVRQGPRLFDYSYDMRSISGNAPLFDFLRMDVSNAGGDQNQYFSVRADKARAYKFDGTVRRFNFFQSLPNFAVNEHNFDLRQQVSDFNLKLFPQRKFRINLGYGRALSKGPFLSTYDYERDEFPILGTMRWESNDYRFGAEASLGRFDIFFEQMFRDFSNDTSKTIGTFLVGNQTTNTSALTSFFRETPTRSRATISRLNIRGDITSRAHLVVRGLYGNEDLDLTQFEETAGIDASGNKIISRIITDSANVNRPSGSADAIFTFDISRNFSLSNSSRFVSYRIRGNLDALTKSFLQKPGNSPLPPTAVKSIAEEFSGLASFTNVLQLNMNAGPKFSATVGLRSNYRDVTLRHFKKEDERETRTTNAFISSVRYRPIRPTTFYLSYEEGRTDNAFVAINALEYRQIKFRSNINLTDKLSVNASFITTDRQNPTRQVKNESTARAFAAAVFWQPNERIYLSGGYDYDYISSRSDIAFFFNFQLKRGRSFYYARQNFLFTDARFALTKRLDLLLAYRYLQDRGVPDDILPMPGPNDFATALPLRRHNPEVRLAYRFSDLITGNITYRHYSYNERDLFLQDYRANILTTSVRFTF